MARGQVARINLVNLAERGSLPIQLDVQFVDMQGNPVARETKTINPTEATSLDFAFNSFRIDADRVELRAVITEHNPPADIRGHNPPDDKPIATSVEVFDADTGRTTFILHNPPADHNPPGFKN